ncbi:phosphoribosylanthranilate isomerase [Aminirod propionatiphilus]|uniref:Phosphoribosylanthranilate isomerase n=1 Tax=Aminirod propionatiphilus TaxID=3415223 RepID=A0ACD1DUI6_9BACT|nr:phosphoribosylanthranilate isomerase [Synergistota bacterium]
MTRVKLCGLTRPEDVRAAVELGFDALGFILVPTSPRRVTFEAVAALRPLVPPFVAVVAVVAGAAEEELDRLVASRLFDAVQFHGGETPDLVASVPVRRIVALSVAERGDLDRARDYGGVADAFLLDTKWGGKRGGTGRSFDWNVLRGFDFGRPIVLAGGLGPENLKRAVEAVGPDAVDLNSRLESAPGVKDRRLMEEAMRVLGRPGPVGEGRGRG